MKERYFTTDHIERESRDLAAEAAPKSSRGTFLFRPDQAALLILDMQEFFLDEGSHAFVPAAQAVLPGLGTLADLFRRSGQPVIFTRHLNDLDNAALMGRWWHDLLNADDPLIEISRELLRPNDIAFDKSQYDAFHETQLQPLLAEAGVTQVVISGVMANLCCETTARSAFVRGFEPFFLVDATAAYNRAFHLASLTNLAFGFAELVMVKELIDAMEGACDD